MSEEITLQSLASDENVKVGYSDKDSVIVDNVRNLVSLNVARMNMNMLVICTNGRAEGSMNGVKASLEKNQVTLAPANVTMTNFMISPDFEFKAFFFTTNILHSFLREKMQVWNEVMYIRHIHVLPMTEKQISYFTHFYDMLSFCMETDDNMPFKGDVIQSLLRAAFLALCGRMKAQLDETSEDTSTSAQTTSLFQRFLHLLQTTEMRHRTVESYASDLCITPKYLSAVCKKKSGKTANEWITEHVMEDIRYYLCTTDLSIKQICSRLGFPNPSFFGKYVRQHFGMTPMQLRQS